MAESIAHWLDKLGLGHYAQAFADNGVELDHLPHLTDDDLKELGLPLGPRRHLQVAVQTLSASQPSIRPSIPSAQAAEARPAEAERRQLTVMFCDLVGSTALSAKFDPEDMREVIRAYQDAVAGEITRVEGHVAKFMGDGVLAYFGWPRSHEDEAERAIRAGLAVIDAVRGLASPVDETLAARVGIATGLVVVGDLVGDEEARERAVVGETPNLAARLQSLAEPGQVVIANSTHRLVGDMFECTDLGVQRLKGFTEAMPAWRVIGASTAASRFEARHAAGLTPMVGREHETALLLDRWVLAKGGEGQVVLLAGEAGIGKSRITRALLERLAGEPHTRLRYYGSSYHTNSALHPVIDQLARAAGFAADDGAEIKIDKLEAVLGRASERASSVAPLLAALLSIPTGERYPLLSLTPQAQKARTLEALVGQLEGLAARQPVLMVLEDAHWIDPTTAELFEQVIERVQRLPVLLVITFRPDFTPPWASHAHTTTLALNRLGRHQGAAIVERLTDGKPLPAEVMDQILAKTDGVPLFVEELTKTVLESGLLRDSGEHYELAGPLPPLAIPSTLHDSLMARLDRLAPVKEVAQMGAVIGREFTHDLLAAVAPLREHQLGDALDQLVAAELIFRRGTPPEASYTFKHALVQEAAYQSLLKSKRQQLHARIAVAIQAHSPETVSDRPEVLAQHYTAAGDLDQAVRFWLAAGRRSLARSANLEAVNHLRRGLDLVSEFADAAERSRTELELQLALGPPLIATQGYTADDTVRAFARARTLCEELDDVAHLFQAIYGLWANHAMRAEHEKARLLAEEFLGLAQQHGDVAPTITGHRVLGWSLSLLGELTAGRHQLEQALALYRPEEHRSLAFRYGQDPRVAALSILAWNAWLLGYPETSVRLGEQALRESKDLNHAFTVAYATYVAGAAPKYLSRDFEDSKAHVDALLAFSREQGFPFWLAYGTELQGALLAQEHCEEDGIELTERAAADLDRLGLGWFRPFVPCALVTTHLDNNNPERAAPLIAQTFARIHKTSERWIEPEMHRLNGEATLLASGDTKKAESDFRRALHLAESQCAKSWELRAATSLARLWAEQRERRKAHDLLAPVYDWFTEGFGTADLKDAKALLDELA